MKQNGFFFFFLVTDLFLSYKNKKLIFLQKKKIIIIIIIKIDFGIIIRFFVLFKADVTGRAEFSRRHHNHLFIYLYFFHEILREKVPGILYFLLAPSNKKIHVQIFHSHQGHGDWRRLSCTITWMVIIHTRYRIYTFSFFITIYVINHKINR